MWVEFISVLALSAFLWPQIFQAYTEAVERRERHKEQAKTSEYLRGYDWAAGRLLRGDESPISLDAWTQGRYNPFDRGIDAAIKAFCEQTNTEDDRI